MAKSPMMQQYDEAKKLSGDALLFFRMGDFYELFHEDAEKAAAAIGLTLTSRDKGENPIPMAGFPHHQLDSYLAQLIQLGYKVAICDQVEDAKKAKGLVKREVTRVVTPGTLTDDALLDPRANNYLAAVARPPGRKRQDAMFGIAWVDLSTGHFYVCEAEASRIVDHLARIAPSECLISDDDEALLQQLGEYNVTKRPDWTFTIDTARERLHNHFSTATMAGFGVDDDSLSLLAAAGAIIDYLNETQKASLDHIDRLIPFRHDSTMEIDQATRRSLELTRSIRDDGRVGSLLGVIDKTVTAMGSRLLAQWLNSPLTSVSEIEHRQAAIGECVSDQKLTGDLRNELREVYDMHRLMSRITTGRASPRDLQYVGRTLKKLPHVKAKLAERKSTLLNQLEAAIDLCPELRAKLEAALVDDCPLTIRDGGVIRAGYDAKLDELRNLATGGKQWLSEYQQQQQEQTGITSLKLGFNRVFGFYFEVTNANKDKLPEYFIRKQTLKNAERYITPELKEYEEKILSAEEKAKELEYSLFSQLRDGVHESTSQLRATADVLAHLDVICGLAELARTRNYCQPKMTDEVDLQILGGRHPVLDILEPQGTFVPNDTSTDGAERRLLLITGPNMAGKSTFIRQTALITIMAQMGSFVPAEKATVGVADRVFARVGASDELAKGQSTFMVEMTETARILNTASNKSLVILDEIGRGTSTYDGISLAWAICEHLHDTIGARTLFATHYHELTELESIHDGVVNLQVSVKEWNDEIVFLHRIVEGAADKSYGIHVARLAGVPRPVNRRAKQILAKLEAMHQEDGSNGRQSERDRTRQAAERPAEFQLSLFGMEEHPIVDELRAFELNDASPLEAMQQIQRWQAQLAEEAQVKPR